MDVWVVADDLDLFMYRSYRFVSSSISTSLAVIISDIFPSLSDRSAISLYFLLNSPVSSSTLSLRSTYAYSKFLILSSCYALASRSRSISCMSSPTLAFSSGQRSIRRTLWLDSVFFFKREPPPLSAIFRHLSCECLVLDIISLRISKSIWISAGLYDVWISFYIVITA